MITVHSNSTDPWLNLALEEFVFHSFPDEDVFLLWRSAPSVVVGSYQNICREVHVPQLHRLGIPVLRRITGGGTVYHDLGNVNYSLITRQEGEVDYDRCLAPMLSALNAIGVPARKNRTCDIAIGDGKISGSAQRMEKGRLLHHGTLLFESDLAVLDRITTHHKNSCFQTKGTLSAICPVTNIRPHLAEDMDIAEFQRRLLEQLGCKAVELSAEQMQEVCRLRDEKYRGWQWTWGKTPAFSYVKDGVFDGKPFHGAYQARKGMISGAVIDCPALDGECAAALLNGARLEPDVFFDICRTLAGERADELWALLM